VQLELLDTSRAYLVVDVIVVGDVDLVGDV
jgi:hypothetical protein